MLTRSASLQVNKSVESKQANVQRLKDYKAKLIVLPTGKKGAFLVFGWCI